MKDPKAIRKAIMTAKSVASLIDPHFARVPMPDLGVAAPPEYVPEHSPAMHQAFGVPMPKGFADGGDVRPYQDPETSHISEWNWRPLEDVRSDLGYMREIPSHVLKFGDFMDEIARKASEQGLTPRDLIKAYTITRSSIQRRAAKTDKVRQAGLPLPDFHDEMIRPEGAFGEWLHTPAGQAYLDAAEKGQVHHGAIEDAVRVMAPFGKHEKDIPDALAWAAAHLPGNESRVSELIHAGRLKASHPAEWRDFTSGIRGIGPSKSGFYASLLGRGDQPTLDARQIILHTGRPTKEATRFLSRKGGAGGVEAVNRLTARQEAMGLGLPERLSPYYQHLAHHAVWDQAGGDETTHEDVMRSMRHAASGGAIMPHEHWIGEIFHRLDGSDAEHYAAGGDVEDENLYAQPDENGLYSHAALAASNLPKTGTPQQMRDILLRQPGVKPTELHWGEYDYAFGDKPEVSRDEIAKQMWVNMPPLTEKTFRYRENDEPTLKELGDLHAKQREELWDKFDEEGADPKAINKAISEMRKRHNQERRRAWHGNPHHYNIALPGGENYREILLQHANGDMFKGVPVHFGGEPDIYASLMVKDRKDNEGSKVLHLDELQSDWAQRGRREGFVPKQGINEAPYVTKTEDWVDLGLKRALREAAEKGHDKLAWSPGSTIADRYNLAKHVEDIFHEKNEDGTHNIVVTDKNGNTIFDREDVPPEKLVDHLGKGVVERIVAGEGLSGDEAQKRFEDAKQAHSDFVERLIDNDVARRRGVWRQNNPGADYPEDQEQMIRDIVRESIANNPSTHAKHQGILEEYEPIKRAYRDAYYDYHAMDKYTSPYRDWRKLSGVDLQIGEKWPFEMYDRMIPKRALRLAKMHDPEAKLETSKISHPESSYGRNDEIASTDLHAIRITPKMRESILKKGFPAYAQGGEVEGHEVANPMSIFPKPQRMWDEDMPGGAYLSMPDKRDVTGHRASSASIGIGEGGKPYFNASRDPAEVTGSPGRGSATVKTNLFKQKAGWKWLDTPEGHENTNTLVSVEHRGKHHYVLHAHFPKGVDLARYPDAPSEPRLRPTTKGNVELGPQVGSISVRGKEHPVHAHAIVKAYGGGIEGYARGGSKNDPMTQHVAKILHGIQSGGDFGRDINPDEFKKYLDLARQTLAPKLVTTGANVLRMNPKSADMKMGNFTKHISDMSVTRRSKGTMMPYSEADLEEMQRRKSSIFPFLGDLSHAGSYLDKVGQTELVEPSEQQGGADFMRSEFALGKDAASYGNRAGAARTLARKIAEQTPEGSPAVGVHVAMGIGSVDSSHHAYEAILRMIPNMPIASKHIEEFDELMREKFPPTTRHPEAWPGVLNTKKAEKFFASRPGTHASAFAKILDSARWQKAGFPDIGEVRFATSEGRLLGHPRLSTGAAFSEIEPDPAIAEEPDLEHRTYPALIRAKKGGQGYMGGSSIPIPAKLMFSDFYKTLKTTNRSGQPIDYDSPAGATLAQQALMTKVPMQTATQEWLDNIMEDRRRKQEEGFKKGGTVRKALMIAKSVKKK